MGFVSRSVLCSNQAKIMPGAKLFHFGILASSVHMIWIKAAGGRFGMNYRYSKDIVYNNFPWPEVTAKQKNDIEKAAKNVLDTRKLYPKSSLASLYDPLAMPKLLLRSHQKLDLSVMRAYQFNAKMTEAKIAGKLIKLHQELTGG
jgi:hypothetical protein